MEAPPTRKINYDDLYRVSRVDHAYPSGSDTWTSPYQRELAEMADPDLEMDRRRAPPSPHVSFPKRVNWQTFRYDWLGNTSNTDDDAHGFYDRSLGSITNGSDKPYQLASAQGDSSNQRGGAVTTQYDAAGS